MRARSRAELRQRLLDKDFTPEEVESTLLRLEELDLVDDREFAEQWVTSRHRHSGRGRQALRHELRTKGIDPSIAEEALRGIDDAEERQRAAELVSRKVGTIAVEKLIDAGERDRHLRRLVAMLVRRGFTHSLAFELATSAIAERRGDAV
nr:regulatory protein RecX [Williamsia sp. CHRR-6]